MKIHLKLAGSYPVRKGTVEAETIEAAFSKAYDWGAGLLAQAGGFSVNKCFEVHLYRDDPNAVEGKGRHLGSIDIIAADAKEVQELPEHEIVLRVRGTALCSRAVNVVKAALESACLFDYSNPTDGVRMCVDPKVQF